MKIEKNRNEQAEKAIELIGDIDDRLIDEAYNTDSEEKLSSLVKAEKNRKLRSSIVRLSISAAACLALILGSVFGVMQIINNMSSSDENLRKHYENEIYVPQIDLPSVELPQIDNISIESLDMLNYYSAMRVLCVNRSYLNVPNLTMLSSTEKTGSGVDKYPDGYTPTESSGEETQKVYYYELEQSEVFSVSKVIFFKIELTDENGFLASKVGTGTVDVVITENNLEPMITFKNGKKYYSCLENSIIPSGKNMTHVYSTHKYIDGFCLVKNLEQDNYSFDVTFDESEQVLSFSCSPYKNGGNNADGNLSVVSQTSVSYVNADFTVTELEEYFGQKVENSSNAATETSPNTDTQEITSGTEKTENEPPERPNETELEFWITENVEDYDFSTHNEIYGWFGAREFYGTGYGETSEYYVKYLITAYPDYADGGEYVTHIEITDPSVSVYGITVDSPFEKFDDVFETMGYTLSYLTDAKNTRIAEKGGIRFVLSIAGVPSLTIYAEVSNREGIIF